MFLAELQYKVPAFKTFLRATKDHKTVDNRETAWTGTLTDLMNQFGFKPLGTGKYGSVFGKSSYPYVIKVFQRDTAYLTWLNFVIKNQNNKWVPKVRGKVIKIGDVFMAVRLEKLTPFTGINPEDELDKAVANGDKDALKVLDYLYANDKLMDFHAGNAMMRGKQMVVTDPLYNWRRDGQFTIDMNDISKFKELF